MRKCMLSFQTRIAGTAMIAATIFFIVGMCITARGQDVPHKISYQGLLTDGKGAPVADGAHTVTTTLYSDRAGTQVFWRGTVRLVTAGGMFNIVLGDSGSPLPAPLVAPLWLGIAVENGQELRPLTAVLAAPYALGIADSAVATSKIQDNAVTRGKITDDYVGHVTFNNKTYSTEKGKDVDISIGANLTMTVDTSSHSRLTVKIDGPQGFPRGGLIAMPSQGPWPGLTATGDSLKFGDTWAFKTAMNSPRVSPGIAVVNGRIYVFGGDSVQGAHLNTVEMYDPATDTWTYKAGMPTARYAFSVVMMNNKIYIIGGQSSATDQTAPPLSTVEEFDPESGPSGAWSTKAPMPTARIGCGVAVLNGKIYVIGGHTSYSYPVSTMTKVVEVFDPISNTWSTASSLPFAITYPHAMTVNNATLQILGGEANNGVFGALAQILEFSPSGGGGIWRAHGTLPLAGFVNSSLLPNGHSLVFINNANVFEYNPLMVGPSAFTVRTPPPAPNDNHIASANGKAYLFIGNQGTPGPTLEYTPATYWYCFRGE